MEKKETINQCLKNYPDLIKNWVDWIIKKIKEMQKKGVLKLILTRNYRSKVKNKIKKWDIPFVTSYK